MTFQKHLSLCVLSVCLVTANSTIFPKKAERQVNGNVQISCGLQDGSPLTDCQFRIWLEYDDFLNEGFPLNLTQGHDTKAQSVVVDDRLQFWATYFGRGLDHGECGINMTDLAQGRYFVACGVKEEGNSWSVDTMALVVYDSLAADTTDNDQRDFEKYALQERETSNPMEFSAADPIYACQLFLSHHRPVTLTSRNPSTSTPWIQASLAGGTCTVTLRGVDSRATGVIWCLYQERADAEWKAFDPILIEVTASSRGNFVYGLLILFFIATILYMCFKKGCQFIFMRCCIGSGANIATIQHLPYEEYGDFDERFNFISTPDAGQRTV